MLQTNCVAIYMRSLLFLQLLSRLHGSVVILPDDYIWRTTGSAWFEGRDADVAFNGYSEDCNREFSTDHLLDLTSHPSKNDQHANLMAVFNALDGLNWKRNDNWGIGDPCFQGWYGVVCDCNGDVVRISLVDNALSGNLPPQLGQITHLSEIYLQTSLRSSQGYLNPSPNQITGSMPSLSDLRYLRVLDVSLNKVTSLPSDIRLNTNLEVLSASGNLLTSLPTDIGQLVKLKVLELNDNNISAVFPISDICQMTKIYVFNIGNNSFSGPLFHACLLLLNPLVFDVAGPHPTAVGSYNLLSGSFSKTVIQGWTNINGGYLSVYQQFGLTGDIPDACLDLRFCYTSNFNAHGNLAWIAGNPGDVPDIVYETINLATQ